MIYGLCFVLLAVGIYGALAKRDVIKVVMALVIMEHAVHLLLLLFGYRDGGQPPILQAGDDVGAFAASSVDPLPQALVLTSLVIGLGALALLVARSGRVLYGSPYELYHQLRVSFLVCLHLPLHCGWSLQAISNRTCEQ